MNKDKDAQSSNDPVGMLYSYMSGKVPQIGSEDDFRRKIQTKDGQGLVYEFMSSEFGESFGTFEDFQAKISQKKSPVQSDQSSDGLNPQEDTSSTIQSAESETLESEIPSTSIEQPTETDILKDIGLADPDAPTEEQKEADLITSRERSAELKEEELAKRVDQTPDELKSTIKTLNKVEMKMDKVEQDLLDEYGTDFFEDYEQRVVKLNNHIEGKEILSEDEFNENRDTLKAYTENENFQLYAKGQKAYKSITDEYNKGFEEFKQKIIDKEIKLEKYVDENTWQSVMTTSKAEGGATILNFAAGIPSLLISVISEITPFAIDAEKVSEKTGAKALSDLGASFAEGINKSATLPDKYNQGFSNAGSAFHTLTDGARQFMEVALLTRGLGAVGMSGKMAVGMSSAALSYRDGVKMAKEAGFSDKDADIFGGAYGMTIGTVNSLISPAAEGFLLKGSMIKGGLAKLAGQKGLGSKWPVVFNTLFEGAEESVFEPLAEVGLKYAYNKFHGSEAKFDIDNPFAREHWNERSTEFILGTVLGGAANTTSYIAHGSASTQEAMFLSIENPELANKVIDKLSPKLFDEVRTKQSLKDRIKDLSDKVINTDLSREDKFKLMVLQDAYDLTKSELKASIHEGEKIKLNSKLKGLKDEIIKLTAPEYFTESESKVKSKEAEEIIEASNSLLTEEKVDEETQSREDSKEDGNTNEQTVEETKESDEGEAETTVRSEAEGEVVNEETNEIKETKEVDEAKAETKEKINEGEPEVEAEVKQPTEPKIADESKVEENPFGESEQEKGKGGRKAQSIEEVAEGVQSGRISVPKGLAYAAKEGEGTLEQAIAEQLTRREQFNLSDVVKETGLTEEQLGKAHFGSNVKGDHNEGALVIDVAEEIAERLGGSVSVDEVQERLIDGLKSNKSNKEIVSDLIGNIMQSKTEGFEDYTEQNYDRIGEIEEQYYVPGEGIDYKGIVRDATKLGLSESEVAYFEEAENRDYEQKYRQNPEEEGEYFNPNESSLKKTSIKATRDRFNLEKLPKPVRKSWEVSYRRAVDGGFHLADKARETAKRVMEAVGMAEAARIKGTKDVDNANLQKATLSEEEHIGLTIREAEIENSLDAAYEKRAEAIKKGVPSTTLDRHIEALENDLDKITAAGEWAGTEAARRLSIRRIAISRNTYSVAKMIQIAKHNKGAALTEEERSAVVGMSKRIREAQEKLEKIREDVDKMENDRLRKIAEDELKEFGLTTKEYSKKASKKAKIRAERKDVLSKIRALTRQLNDITHLSVEMPSLMYKLAKTYIQEGVVELPDLVKKIKKDIPEASERDVYISLYSRSKSGKASVETELQKNLRNLQREAKLLVKIENLEKGITEVEPQSASAKKEWTKKVTDLQDKLTEMLAEVKKVEGDKKRVAQIEAKIDEIQNHILNHSLAEPKKRVPKVESPEVEAAKAKLEKARETLRKQTAFDKKFEKLTDEILEIEDALNKGQILRPEKRKGSSKQEPTMIQEAKKRLADAKEEMNWLRKEADKLARLEEKIDNAKKGKVPPSKLKKDIAESDAVEAARKVLNELEKLARLQQKEAELKDRIKRGDTAKTPSKPKPEESAEIKAAKGKVKELQKLMRTQQAVKDMKEKIARLKKGDLSVMETISPNIPIVHSKEVHQKTLEAMRDLALARKEAKGWLRELKPKDTFDKFMDLWNITRTLKASIDLSGTLRQGLYMTLLDGKAGTKAFVEALGVTFRSEKGGDADAELHYQSIIASPDYYLAEEAGLEITEPDALYKSEEFFQSDWTKNLLVVGKGVKASERHMVTYLNAMRWATWQNFLRKNPDIDLASRTQYARWINVISGRAQVGKTGLKVASTVMFAPKYTISRFQMLWEGGKAITHTVGRAAGKEWGTAASKLIARDFIKQVGWLSGLAALAYALGADIELDPKDSDFLKLHIYNTRYDFLAGQAQVLRVMTQLGIKLGGLGGEVYDQPESGAYTGTFNRSSVPMIILRFMYYKAHPALTSAVMIGTGYDAIGNPVGLGKSLFLPIVPISLESLVYDELVPFAWPLFTGEEYKRHYSTGFGHRTVAGISDVIGIGASAYDDELYSQDMKKIMNTIGSKPNAVVANIPDFIRDDKFLKQEYKLEFSMMLAGMIRKYELKPDMHPDYLKREVKLMSKAIRKHLNHKYVRENRDAILEWEAKNPNEKWW